MTANLTYALIIVLCLDLILFLGQAAITDVNPEGTQFFQCEGSTFATGYNCSSNGSLTTQNPKDALPGGAVSIEPTTGNIFTDMFVSIKTYLVEKTKLGYILGILTGPAGLLDDMLPDGGVFDIFVYSIGALWLVMTAFFVASFVWGRQGE